MGFNLTNEKIKDTYQQLGQISGSVLVNGTGTTVTDLDITASHATFAESATSASYAPTILPSGILSSSAQIADDISGSFTSTSASIATDINTKLDSSTFTSFSSSVSTEIEVLDEQVAVNITRLNSLTAETSSYAVKTSNNTFTGTQTFNNIAVNGTGSFAVIESVTGSAKIIGDAYIILNNNTPSERYAGVVVQDSGSTNNTASLEFDGQTNDWFYEYTDDGGVTAEHGVVMFGPGYNTKGSHVYPSNNTILKGTGDHHIVDSNITDDGTSVTVSTSLTASGFKGDLDGTASFATTTTNANVNFNATDVGRIMLAYGTAQDTPLDIIGNTTVSMDAGSGTIYGTKFIGTASLADTASNATTFTISDTLALGDSTITVTSASATGSLIDNVHPAIASGSTAIKHIVTLDQDAYDFISGSGAVSDDTFYIISDAGDNVYPGNLQVEGQIYTPTFAGTIASSTSSISFDNGNFATLNCASSTFLANPTNLQGGTTYTLIVTNGANISGYGTAWKFAGGTEPTLSANTDVITAVSDGTSLYAAALADFS